jgi:hypothetical protein
VIEFFLDKVQFSFFLVFQSVLESLRLAIFFSFRLHRLFIRTLTQYMRCLNSFAFKILDMMIRLALQIFDSAKTKILIQLLRSLNLFWLMNYLHGMLALIIRISLCPLLLSPFPLSTESSLQLLTIE